METKKIFVTGSDMEKLRNLVRPGQGFNGSHEASFRQLREELDKATVVDAKEIPADVVTMNSEVKFRDMETREEFVYRLVYPSFANAEKKRISILAPIGMALLGYRVGDVVEWRVPAGVRKLKIEEVIYQPEANGEFDL